MAETTPHSANDAQPPKRNRTRRIVLAVVLVPVVLVLLLIGVLQTTWGATTALRLALDRLDLFENAELTFAEASGGVIGGLQLTDVNLVRGDSTLAHIDTLAADYKLLALLGRRLHLEDVYLARPRVWMAQTEDSTWNVATLIAQDTLAVEDTTKAPFIIQVDNARIASGEARIDFVGSDGDSTTYVQHLDLRLRDLLSTGTLTELRARVDTLTATATDAVGFDTLRLATAAVLVDGQFALDTLRVTSGRSQVTGGGTLRLPAGPDDTLNDIGLRIDVAPLAFDDLRLFAPGLAAGATVEGRLEATGSLDLLGADVDLAFSDGATVALDASLTPTTQGDLVYQGEALIRRLNPALFAAQPDAQGGLISGDVRFDLNGPSLDALDGTAALDLSRLRFGALALAETRLRADVTSGVFQLDLASGFRGVRLNATGQVVPFAETPTYDVRTRFRSLDIGRVTQNPEQTSDLNGALRVQGRGFSADEANLTATLNLEPSSLNGTRVDGGQIVARVAQPDVRVSGALQAGGGTLALNGSATLGEVLRYRLDRAELTNVNVLALAGNDTTASSVTGTLSAQGSGTDPQRMSLTATLALRDSRFAAYTLDTVDLGATLRRGTLGFDLNLAMPGANLQVGGTVQPFLDLPTYQVTEGAFQNIQIEQLTPQADSTAAQASNLSGTFTASGRGFDPQTMYAEADVGIDAGSTFNAEVLGASTARLVLADQVLTVDADLNTQDGGVQLVAAARPFEENPTFEVQQSRFANFDVGRLLGIDALDLQLNGDLQLSGGFGGDLSALQLDTRANLAGSVLFGETLSAGEVIASVANGNARIGLDLGYAGGTARLTGRAQNLGTDRLSYDLEGRLQQINIARLIGIDTLDSAVTLDFDMEGTGQQLATMDARGTFRADSSTFATIDLDALRGQFALRDGLLTLDSLFLASNVADINAGGQLALADSLAQYRSDFSFDGQIKSLTPLRALLPNSELISANDGRIQGRVYSAGDRLRYEVSTDLSNFIYDTFRFAALDLRAIGELSSGWQPLQSEVRGTIGFFALPNDIVIEETTLAVFYSDQVVDFDVDFRIDEGRTADVQGLFNLGLDEPQLTLNRMFVQLDQDAWNLLIPATLTIGDGYRVQNFLLTTAANDQQIALDGIIDPNGQQALGLSIEAFRVGTIADLLGFTGLDGSLNGILALDGPAASPRIQGDLDFAIETNGVDVGTFDIAVAYDSLRLQLNSALIHTRGDTLALDGVLPLDFRLAQNEQGNVAFETSDANEGGVMAQPVDFTLATTGFNIDWLDPFIDPLLISDIGGNLTADVALTGTRRAPEFSGDARLADGFVALTEQGVTYTDIGAVLAFEDNEIVVRQANLTSDGTASAIGSIAFENLSLGAFDIDVQAENFLAIDNAEYRAVASGYLTLTGPLTAPVVGGDLEVQSLDVFLNQETVQLEPVQLTEADLLMLEEQFGVRVTEADTSTFVFFDAMTLDNLQIQLERDSWVRSNRNPSIDIQFIGELDVSKPPRGEISVFGNISVLPERSRIEQFGKPFTLETGSLQFNGSILDPFLNITARYSVESREDGAESFVIFVDLEGSLQNLESPEFRSEPPGLDLPDIVSVIATGRPASQAFQGGGLGTVETLAYSQIAGLVQNVAANSLGLDVVEINYEGSQIVVTVGVYLSPKLFAAARQPISTNDAGGASSAASSSVTNLGVIIEYQLMRALLLRLERDQGIEAKVLYRYSY
ncbi:MAG: translocation/assembly module TamB domain-containing protein [Bacteroidota bacterium]